MSRSVGNTPDVTSLQGGTAGQVAYQSAPSTTAFAGPGTSGQVLTSNGASAPTFQTVSAGAVSPTYRVYSSGSGTYTSPVGCSYIIVEMVGGGGAGARAAGSYAAGGGGGGAYGKIKYTAGSYSYSVGAATSSTTTDGTSGSNGNNTTFGSRTAQGGGGGLATQGGYAGTISGSGGTLLLEVIGSIGGCQNAAQTMTSAGGGSFWSGSVFPTSATFSSSGGQSWGGGGSGSNYSGAGNPLGAGGPGKAGQIIITEYY